MDLTLWTGWELTSGAGVLWGTWSAVSRVVGRSISRWIWIPSPGPMWVMWLKLEGALIILDLLSGLLKQREAEHLVTRNRLNIHVECRGLCMKTFNEDKNTNNHCTVQHTLYMYSAQVFDEKKNTNNHCTVHCTLIQCLSV